MILDDFPILYWKLYRILLSRKWIVIMKVQHDIVFEFYHKIQSLHGSTIESPVDLLCQL
jgi:hypothetical protein